MRHISHVTFGSDKEYWRCRHCGRMFATKKEAQKHQINCLSRRIDDHKGARS